MKKVLFAALLIVGTAGCTVYQSTGPDPQARAELTPVCLGGKTTKWLKEDAVRVELNRGATLGECE
ncbi:MAG: hypothetical protein QNJ40_25805 [Xanthomonadales bacterium]|nr:hypothetical protein [Xanthomonadales bacterium]